MRALILVVTLAALCAAPGVAGAANVLVVPGAQASRMTALDGTIVWVTGKFPDQLLMQRTPDGKVAPVLGAPRASYFSLDLGHDTRGGLVLTYARCVGTKRCRVISDDLAGRRATFKRLASSRCSLTTAPSRWRARVAYGLNCVKRRNGKLVFDAKRSGLFVRSGSGRARQLPLPPDAVRFGSTRVSWVDLRGGNLAAATTGVYSYAFTQTVAGAGLRADLVATSEGDSDASIRGLSLGTGGAMWTLVDAAHGGDPNIAIIEHILGSGCNETETLVNPPGATESDGYLAEALAVDGGTVYLYVPRIGIVAHDFVPARPCG